MSWLVSTVAGIGVGLIFYVCVRIRVLLGPVAREHFGNVARHGTWLATILLMIGAANFGLLLLRNFLSANGNASNGIVFEIWFALLSLAVGGGLVFVRTWRTR